MIPIERNILLNLANCLSTRASWRRLAVDPISEADIPNTFIMDGRVIAELRQLWEKRIEPAVTAIKGLERGVNELIAQGPRLVVSPPPTGISSPDHLSPPTSWPPNPPPRGNTKRKFKP